MIRKRIAVLLAMLLLCLNILSAEYYVEADENIITYELNDEVKFIYDCTSNKLEISGVGSAYVGDISTVIGDNYKYVKEVVVDEGITALPLFVKKIDGPNFTYKKFIYEGCTELERVTIPSTVSMIPGGAFFNCSSLKEVNGIQNVTQIGNYAFYGTSITNVSFGNSLQYIGEYAFANCEKLVSAEFGNGLQEVGACAFENCSNLAALKLGDMKDYSMFVDRFVGCDKLYDSNGCLSINDVLIGIKETDDVETFIVSEGIREIASYSMYGVENYEEVVLPSTLEIIDDRAFCRIGAKKINIPDSVKYIGRYAFAPSDIESIELPETIRTIGDSAFAGCKQLENVDFKIDTTTSDVGLDIFRDCPKLADENGSIVIGGLMLGDIDDRHYEEKEDGSSVFINNIINITKNVKEIFVALCGSDIKVEDGQNDFVLDNGSLYTSDYNTLLYAKFVETEDDTYTVVVKSGCKKIAFGALSGNYYSCEITIPSSVTDIYDGNAFENSRITIKGTAVSYANQYADRYGYEFIETELGKYQGDVDGSGDVNLLDTKIVLKVALGIDKCTDDILASADIDLDGNVTLLDAKAILKASLGISKLDSVKDVADGTIYTFPEIEEKEEQTLEINSAMHWYPYIAHAAPKTGDSSVNKETLMILMFGAVVVGCCANRKKRRV